jgi:hypothetical protein
MPGSVASLSAFQVKIGNSARFDFHGTGGSNLDLKNCFLYSNHTRASLKPVLVGGAIYEFDGG